MVRCGREKGLWWKSGRGGGWKEFSVSGEAHCLGVCCLERLPYVKKGRMVF